MLIGKPEEAQNQKKLLILMIMDILKQYSDADHPMTRQGIIEKVLELYGYVPARNTIYTKLKTLEEVGFPIVLGTNGVYYDGHDLTDGELRFLIDSVLYSDFVTHQGAGEMIETLAAFGSLEFQKLISKQKGRLAKTRKNKQTSIFLTIEDVQTAIEAKRQISCNYLTHCADGTTVTVYPDDILINPYDLIYKNGRYYLLGALEGSDRMLSWRVDRLCNVKIQDTKCRQIPLLKEIKDSGGISAYIEAQPDLCGGVVETFRIQCFRNAIDDVVDAFGMNYSIAPEQSDNYDDETVILSVKATRESMKAWAFTHAGSVVVISPDDFRKEITDSLSEARRLYQVTGKPLHVRIFTARDFPEAIRFSKKRSGKSVIYHGKGRYLGRGTRELERIDLSLLSEIPDLHSLSLSDCIIDHAEYLSRLPFLRRLSLNRCEFPEESAAQLAAIEDLQTDDLSLALNLAKNSPLRSLTLLGCDLKNADFVSDISSLRRLSLVHCDALTDCSALQAAVHIERLEISDCRKLKDFSFLNSMKKLKELKLNCPQLGLDGEQEIKEALESRGVRVYSRFLRERHDENDSVKPGMEPSALR